MDQQKKWFENFQQSEEYKVLKDRPIAYFCFEFAISEDSPTYAGGLGILAGDMVRECVDQKIPLVAVGLYYHEGYLHHELYSEGTALKSPMKRTPEELGFSEVVDENRKLIKVQIPMEGRKINISAWEKQIGTVRIFMLETDLPENDQSDRKITNRLYIDNKEIRLKQEIVLGIGGLRILEALKIHPLIYHLNEGHSALLAFEIAHHEMREYSKPFMDELERTKHHLVFTNHTLVAAGNDLFPKELITALLADYAKELQIPVQDLIGFGLIPDSSIFSMTNLALRMADHISAVSNLHAEKAKDLWPDFSMVPITNGIHVGTWDKLGKSQIRNPKSETNEKNQNINDQKVSNLENSNLGIVSNFDIRTSDFWSRHQENKRELLAYIKKKTAQVWDENTLLLGWGRRMVGYKRPLALFQQKEKLLHLLKDEKRPVRIIMAGSAHESDTIGADTLEELQRLIVSDFDGYVAYLPNYNMKTAKLMTSGCDIWLNTPVVGFEACGTSGMKACLNGVLPCTTKDGWLADVELFGVGWVLDSDTITESLMQIIEREIIPMYYFKDKEGVPGAWVDNMLHARKMILENYSTTRMLKEYFENLYSHSLTYLKPSV